MKEMTKEKKQQADCDTIQLEYESKSEGTIV